MASDEMSDGPLDETSDEMIVSGDNALRVAEALNATTLRILQIISRESHDVSTLVVRMGLSEAYIREQLGILERLKLLNLVYKKGPGGMRKVPQPAVNVITIVINPIKCVRTDSVPSDSKART